MLTFDPVLQLRAEAEQHERERDRELMATLARREDALTAHELRLEEEARSVLECVPCIIVHGF